MKIARVLALCAVLATVPVFAGVKIQHDDEASFDGVKTFAWAKGAPAARKHIEKWIHNAIEAHLKKNGILHTEETDPDVLVISYAFADVDMSLMVDFFKTQYSYFGVFAANTSEVTDGTIAIEIRDPESGEPMWLAIATKTLIGRQSDAQIKKKVEKMIARMMSKYPPR